MVYVIFTVLALIVLFVLICSINAVSSKAKAPALTEKIPNASAEEQAKYAERLGRMIRCETVSVKDSYDDTEFLKLRSVVEELFPLVHSRCERMIFSDDCWIYKLKGKDEKRNIMLMSHHDVVAGKGEWKHPAFCGEVHDGALWGRGTVDTKTPLFAELQALEELLENGYEPPCNVYIGSSHNEEIGGDGIPTALKYFEEQNITFEIVLDEGGAVIAPPLPGMNCKCAMMAVHEKGIHRIICTAEEGSSHTGLAANTDTPVARMSAFIAEVNKKKPFVTKLYPQVKAMFTELCPYTSFGIRFIFSNLWCFGNLLKSLMPKINSQAGAMVGTTCSFNSIEGDRDTKKCTAKAMLRYIDPDDFKRDMDNIKAIADKYGVVIEDGENNEYHKPADISKAQFSYTRECIREIFPNVASTPYILPAGTDGRHLSDICDCVIRFAPITMDDQQFASVHSENENISLESIGDAVAFYRYFIENYK